MAAVVSNLDRPWEIKVICHEITDRDFPRSLSIWLCCCTHYDELREYIRINLPIEPVIYAHGKWDDRTVWAYEPFPGWEDTRTNFTRVHDDETWEGVWTPYRQRYMAAIPLGSFRPLHLYLGETPWNKPALAIPEVEERRRREDEPDSKGEKREIMWPAWTHAKSSLIEKGPRGSGSHIHE